MSDLWIIKDVAIGKVLHYFDEEFLANEKLAQLQGVILKRLARLSDLTKLQEFEPSEVEECRHCTEIINMQGKWTWLIHKREQESSNGKRCGRCKDDH